MLPYIYIHIACKCSKHLYRGLNRHCKSQRSTEVYGRMAVLEDAADCGRRRPQSARCRPCLHMSQHRLCPGTAGRPQSSSQGGVAPLCFACRQSQPERCVPEPQRLQQCRCLPNARRPQPFTGKSSAPAAACLRSQPLRCAPVPHKLKQCRWDPKAKRPQKLTHSAP